MPSPLQQFARQTPPYTVPDETYRAALQGGTITEADLREWGMSEERIQGLSAKSSDPVRGCTDPAASNYNAEATQDDGSCNYPTKPGCTDPKASNYDSAATVDDGSCEYPVVSGCMDPEAQNYNPNATVDDGSCIPHVMGCMDPKAENYNPQATKDNGSCVYPGDPLKKLVNDVNLERKTVNQVTAELGITADDYDNIQRHFNDNPLPEWEGTPVLPARKTDLWVLGIAASGKSAMLSAILGRLNAQGQILGAEFSSRPEGFLYRSYLENAYRLKMFPQSTQTEGFNFMPMDLLVERKKSLFGRKVTMQPCNLIEMAGEKVKGVLEAEGTSTKEDTLMSLEWLKSKNSKVITIVLDITSRELNQLTALNRVFSMLLAKGVLARTEKVILLATKVDKLDCFDPNGGARLQEEVEKIINRDFRSLKETIETFYSGEVVTMPFSVGGDIVRNEYLRGERHIHFIDNYINEFRMAIPVRTR
jgi:hypothetical protein